MNKTKQFMALAAGVILLLFIIWMLHSVGVMGGMTAGMLALVVVVVAVVLLIIWLLHPNGSWLSSNKASANDIFEELVDDYRKDMKDTLKQVIKEKMNE